MKHSAKLRIMTYNVHSCIGTDGKLSTYRIAQVIAEYRPDVVALQELDVGMARTNYVHQAREIAAHLDMDFHFHPCREIEEEKFGNALLSRHPLKLMRAGALPGHRLIYDREKRGALWASVLAEGSEFNIITSHFGHLRKERMAQAEALLGTEWASHTLCRPPFAVCGDFNTLPVSPVYKRFRSSLFDAQLYNGVSPFKTFPSFRPFFRIDHIFLSSGLEVCSVQAPRTRLTLAASDHLPLIADVRFP